MIRRRFALPLTACLLAAGPAPAQVAREVAFRVGRNASIGWFAIDDPSIYGTLTVNNPPYPGDANLNAAVVDVGRNRLVFNDNGSAAQGYAIDLAGLVLNDHGTNSVTVTSLGAWPGNSTNAGYRRADGKVYYHTEVSDQLRRLDFDPNGLIAGFTAAGNFAGAGLPNAVSNGDLDFAADGSVWVSGTNDNDNARLWHFDFPDLNALVTHNPADFYNGLSFNAAGDTLYGYSNGNGTGPVQYGRIDPLTGTLATVLSTDAALFGLAGDLTSGTTMLVVPEPSSLALAGLAAVAGAVIRRRRRTAPETAR